MFYSYAVVESPAYMGLRKSRRHTGTQQHYTVPPLPAPPTYENVVCKVSQTNTDSLLQRRFQVNLFNIHKPSLTLKKCATKFGGTGCKENLRSF